MTSAQPTYIVGIGGSAGGLKAYQELFEALPADTGMAFVVVAHMNPDGHSLLPKILSWSASMPLQQAAEGMRVEGDHVYVITPNTDLTIDDFTFKSVSPRTMTGGHHRQVDIFLKSLADAMKARAISIILSGGDGDGTKGSEHIKANGGITFAQDLSAQVDSMPLNAQASGCIDHVLPPDEISAELVNIAGRTSTAP